MRPRLMNLLDEFLFQASTLKNYHPRVSIENYLVFLYASEDACSSVRERGRLQQ